MRKSDKTIISELALIFGLHSSNVAISGFLSTKTGKFYSVENLSPSLLSKDDILELCLEETLNSSNEDDRLPRYPTFGNSNNAKVYLNNNYRVSQLLSELRYQASSKGQITLYSSQNHMTLLFY